MATSTNLKRDALPDLDVAIEFGPPPSTDQVGLYPCEVFTVIVTSLSVNQD